jgi:hypothetical protein
LGDFGRGRWPWRAFCTNSENDREQLRGQAFVDEPVFGSKDVFLGLRGLPTPRWRKADSNFWSHLERDAGAENIGKQMEDPARVAVVRVTAALIEEVRFARDSPLEGTGFELSVPLGGGDGFEPVLVPVGPDSEPTLP